MKLSHGIFVLVFMASSLSCQPDRDDGPTPGGPVPPDGAWQQDLIATRDPALGYAPTERLLAVYEQARAARAAQPFGTPFVWESRGPYEVGGRARAVMFDPNDPSDLKVWAGGVSGGLWTTDDITDAATVWTPVDDFWESLSVTSMAHDPTNTQLFYVGTGEGWGLSSTGGLAGFGVWKSVDGGVSWARLPATLDFAYVNDLVVRDEAGQGVLYVAVDATSYDGAPSSNNHGLWRSTDGGLSFTQVLPLLFGSPYAPADIEIGADNRLHVGTLQNPAELGGGTALFSDDGLGWSSRVLLAGGRRVELATAPSNANYVYALIEGEFQLGGARRSVDGGNSWTTPSGTLPTNFANFQAWYDLILTVDPADHLRLFAGAVRLQRSLNGMDSWAQINSGAHSDFHALAYRPGSSSQLVLGTDGGIYYMANAQLGSPTAAKRNNGFNVTQFYSAAIHPMAGEHYFLAGAQDNGTEKFQGPGVVTTQGVVGGDGMFCFINQLDPTYQISSHILNNYYRSTNGGLSFQPMPDVGGGLFRNPGDYDPHQDVLYSSRDHASIHRISGIQATPVASSLSIPMGSGFGEYASALTVSPHTTGSTTLFIGTQIGRVFKVAGAETNSPTITEITGNLAQANVSQVEVGTNEDELRLSLSNFGVVSVWETTDGGTQWVDKEGDLPDMPVRWLLSNPTDREEVLLATEVGVWRTTDFSSTAPDWEPANTGLANVRVDMLRLRASDNLVAAATHGRGLYTSESFDGAGTPSAGRVPDGGDLPGTPLRLARAAGDDITLSWGPTCVATDTDYAIYEGTLGDFTSHTDVTCGTGGLTMETITPASSSSYYLVVPRNTSFEGSYGTDSNGDDRPQGAASCVTQSIAGC